VTRPPAAETREAHATDAWGPPPEHTSIRTAFYNTLGNSRNSTYRILHRLPLWERRIAYFTALELIAKHKIWEQ
jgi:hypothetical protein